MIEAIYQSLSRVFRHYDYTHKECKGKERKLWVDIVDVYKGFG